MEEKGEEQTDLLNGRDVSGGNVASDDVRLEGGILSGRLVKLHGFDAADNLTVLTRSSRLLLVRVGEFDRLRDGLSESDAGFAGDTLDVVLSLHALDVDVEVELTHSRNDGLSTKKGWIRSVADGFETND